MPATSRAQRQAAGIAYQRKCKKPKKMPRKGSPAYRMAKNMTCRELKHFASRVKSKKKKSD